MGGLLSHLEEDNCKPAVGGGAGAEGASPGSSAGLVPKTTPYPQPQGLAADPGKSGATASPASTT